jgi:hypothetical protein
MIIHSSMFQKRFSHLLIVFLLLLLIGCIPVVEDKAVESATAEEIAAGNVDNGHDLFMGYAHFEHEGPPCMGCHSVGENGILGGGAMGPNLTNVSVHRSDAEVLGVLTNTGPVTSPVMQPIYADYPLTAREQADLLAFMKASAGQPESDKELLVIGISLAGFAGAVVVLGFVYRNRLRGVRRALVEKGTRGRS